MGFTLGRAAEEILANQCSNWPGPVTITHSEHSPHQTCEIIIKMEWDVNHESARLLIGHWGGYWPLIVWASPGSPGQCCRGWWSAASPDTPPTAFLKKIFHWDWDLLLLFYYILCPRFGRQEVNYGRLNEFVNNAFRPTPELYCKRNFLKIIARLAQLMIQIVANCDKSCQFLVCQKHNDQLCKNLSGTIHNREMTNLKLWYFL